MDFYKYPLTKLFHIPQIVTIHYFEYSRDFRFDGESHDFWEFLCVDKGEVNACAGTKGQSMHPKNKGFTEILPAPG